MKKVILLLLFIGFYSLPANAQKVKDVKNLFIASSGTHFERNVKDSKWSNRNGKSFTKATYKTYTGETFVTIKASKKIEMLLKFAIEVEQGDLKLKLVNAENNVIFEKTFTKNDSGEAKIALEENKDYKVRFIGNNTNGSYFCQWIEQ